MLESLEDRKLLSLVVDVRAPGGGSTASASQVGQVVNLELWATATGKNASGTDDGLQNLFGSVVSTNASGGTALGTLKLTLASPFNGTGSAAGEQSDLDGDGDLDVGNLDPAGSTSTGLMLARANTPQTSGGTVLSNGRSFKVADITFTVTKILSGSGASTQIKFVPHNTNVFNSVNAVWIEDGATTRQGTVTNSNGTYSAGTAVTLKRDVANISGKVFNDKNGNGVFDGKDTRLKGIQLFIDGNGNGKLDTGERSVRSTGSGLYTIPDLKAGTYKVRVSTPPAGFRLTKPGGAYTVNLATGVDATGKNWGYSPLTIIPGNVFSDANGNGVQDVGEKALAFWRVFSDVNGDGVFSNKTDRGVMTDAAGKFSMEILPAGKWVIYASVPTGYVATTPAGAKATVTVASGATASPTTFGIRKLS
jgi:hypothetical protein